MRWWMVRALVTSVTALGVAAAAPADQWAPWFPNRNLQPPATTVVVPAHSMPVNPYEVRRPQYRSPVTQSVVPRGVPTTTYFAPSGSFNPTTTYYAPTATQSAPPLTHSQGGTAAPATPTAVAPAFTQQVTVNYRPETKYRTRWMRVPVTHYKPVVTTDPTTGTQTAHYQPCTSYRWQLSRVPYITYHASYGAATTCAPVRPPVTTQPAIPYYQQAPAGSVIPSQPQPSIPGVPPAGIRLAPPPGSSAPAAAPAGSAPSSAEPADVAPRLKPEIDQASPSTTIRSEPNTQPSSTELNGANGAAPESGPLRLRPVPDPDAPAKLESKLEAPQLLKARDRTAARSGAWEVVPIVWSVSTDADVPRERNAPPAAAMWDDTGWSSLRPPR